MERNYRILAAVSELCAGSTAFPTMRDIMLRLSVTYREMAEVARGEPGVELQGSPEMSHNNTAGAGLGH